MSGLALVASPPISGNADDPSSHLNGGHVRVRLHIWHGREELEDLEESEPKGYICRWTAEHTFLLIPASGHFLPPVRDSCNILKSCSVLCRVSVTQASCEDVELWIHRKKVKRICNIFCFSYKNLDKNQNGIKAYYSRLFGNAH